MEVKITVKGKPIPKQRPRLRLRRNKVFVYVPRETKEYERKVREAAKNVYKGSPIRKPVEVSLDFF